MKPYIIRLVSSERKAGKTTVGTLLVNELIRRGFKVAVIKHSHSRLSIRKDTGKYLRSGAEAVVAVGPSYSAIYLNKPYEDLGNAIALLPKAYGLVIVEGFKKCDIGDVIAVVKDLNELNKVVEEVYGNVIAVVTRSTVVEERAGLDTKVFGINDIPNIADYIVANAIRYILSQTANLNCGHCGYSTCIEFSKAYLRGEVLSCPVMNEVKLLVNGKQVHLTPFVKKVIMNTVLGLVSTLKDVPKDAREIRELELKIKNNNI